MLDKQLLEELKEFVQFQLKDFVFYAETSDNMVLNSNMIIEPSDLDEFIKTNLKPTLKDVLFSFIDEKGCSDAEIYKRAAIDRRHFSKIRSNPRYQPRKTTIVALALALQLDRKETDKLLSSAGFSLSNSDTYDLVIQFCIERKIYDVNQVNHALDHFKLRPLTGA
ncbi:hypothetical protein [Mesobacillus harenae]|uniref:hypothetical protein n=1 Tax=Mesobacillus harenae TaxID=2213203 RepID=UPI0015803883|nr:hypothetical protein [Mesobacillus harenae]